MKKRFHVLALFLCGMLLFTSCGTTTISFTLEDSGPSLPDAPPRSTLAGIHEAGKYPLKDDPLIYTNEEAELETEVYQLDEKQVSVKIAGCATQDVQFQFVNGELTNIAVQFVDGDSCDKVAEKLTELYGEPTVKEAVGNRREIWDFEGEYVTQVTVLHRENHAGSFQIAYLWFAPAE